jgi:hypothetical protein
VDVVIRRARGTSSIVSASEEDELEAEEIVRPKKRARGEREEGADRNRAGPSRRREETGGPGIHLEAILSQGRLVREMLDALARMMEEYEEFVVRSGKDRKGKGRAE